jgi:toxin CcdB
MRFDVYKMPPGGRPGLLVDVQSDLLSDLPRRVVVPLISDPKLGPPIKELNPHFFIYDERYTFVAQEIASIPKSELKLRITSLAAHQDEITRALDLLLTGF